MDNYCSRWLIINVSKVYSVHCIPYTTQTLTHVLYNVVLAQTFITNTDGTLILSFKCLVLHAAGSEECLYCSSVHRPEHVVAPATRYGPSRRKSLRQLLSDGGHLSIAHEDAAHA